MTGRLSRSCASCSASGEGICTQADRTTTSTLAMFRRLTSSAAETERRNRHYAHATTPVPRRSLGIVSGLSDEDWLKWWDVNMHGVFYCTRAALRCMEPQRSGRIINIASVDGLGAGSMHSPGYAATKAGVISLTQTTAYDVAGANILVNAIACGGVQTPPFEAYLSQASEQEKNSLFHAASTPTGAVPQVTTGPSC